MGKYYTVCIINESDTEEIQYGKEETQAGI